MFGARFFAASAFRFARPLALALAPSAGFFFVARPSGVAGAFSKSAIICFRIFTRCLRWAASLALHVSLSARLSESYNL